MDCSMLESQVQRTLESVAAFINTRDDAWALPSEAGAFLHALILTRGATRGLELGTSYGYSGVWLGAGLRRNRGTLITIDREARKTEIAGKHFRDAGLAETIEARVGVISEVLEQLQGPFDFVLIDADKPASLGYLKQIRPKLAPRAAVVTDNILHPPHDWTEFLAYVRSDPGFYSTLVKVGNGMEVTVNIAERNSV